MLDVGFQELIIIFVVALLVFGPKKLPEIGRSLGKGIGELRRALDGVKASINAEEEQVRRSVLDEPEKIRTREEAGTQTETDRDPQADNPAHKDAQPIKEPEQTDTKAATDSSTGQQHRDG